MEPALKDIGYLLDTSIVCETVLEECSFASVSPVHITAPQLCDLIWCASYDSGTWDPAFQTCSLQDTVTTI